MKRYLAFLLLPLILFSQPGSRTALLYSGRNMFGTTLNGSTQTWYNAAPTSADMNGPQRITSATDRGFETTVGNWTGAGNHSITRSSTDGRTGSWCGAIVASAAGDATTNYVNLPASAFTTLVIGEKYTIQVWGRSNTATTTMTLKIGGQTVTSATLSTVAGSFTKGILTFTATASDTGQPLRVYLSKAATVYIDDISLNQAYDAMLVCFFKTAASGVQQDLFSGRNNGAAGFMSYVKISVDTDNKLRFVAVSESQSIDVSALGTAVNDNKIHSVIITMDRTGNYTIYLDNVAIQTAAFSSLGQIMMPNFGIGSTWRDGAPIAFWSGNIGPVQFVLFNSLPSDIVNTVNTISIMAKKNGLPKAYNTGRVVLNVDWKNGGIDKGVYGNHLTPSGNPATRLFVVGDSKSIPAENTWQNTLTSTGNDYLNATPFIAVGGYTNRHMRDTIDAHLLKVSTTPDYILYNLGINDILQLATRDSVIAQCGYNLNALHTKWPNARIYLMRPWANTVTAAQCDTMAAWIDVVLSSRASYASAGPDERVWLKGSDNGSTNTSDGVHYSTSGQLACAAQWRYYLPNRTLAVQKLF